MLQISRVTSKNQITIPLDVRNRLGAKPGDSIIFRTNATDEIIVENVRRDNAHSLRGALGTSESPYVPIQKLRRYFHKDGSLQHESKEGDPE